MADASRLIETGIVPDLARELAAQINAGVGNPMRLVELGMVPILAAAVTTQITSGGNSRRLVELGFPPAAALEIVKQISPANPTDGVLAQVGDSIAAGYLAPYAYINRMGYGAGITIANQYSITGRQVSQIPTDVPNGLTSLYQAGKPNVAIFERGTNDIRVSGTTASALYSMVAGYIATYKSQGFYVAITTLTPYTDAQDNATTRQATLDYNTLVRLNSAGADSIIDFAADSVMGTYPASPNDTTLYIDKLHPTGLGQDRLATVAKPIVDQLLLRAPRLPSTVTLGALTLSGTLTNGTASSGTISGATPGSTITSNVTGLAVNSAARTYTWSGTGTAGTTANGLVETLTGATNTGRQSPITVAVAGAAATFVGSPLPMTSATYATDTNAAFGQTLTGGYGRTAGGTFGTAGQWPIGTPAGFPFCYAVRFKAPTVAPSGATIIVSQGDRAAIGIGSDGRLVANVSPQGGGAGGFINGGGYTGGNTNPILLDGADHTVVLNVTATGATLFLDGAQIGTITQTNNTVANTTPFGVRHHGASNPASFFFTGNITEVATFNAEQLGTVVDTPLSFSKANIVELWHLDGSGVAATS